MLLLPSIINCLFVMIHPSDGSKHSNVLKFLTPLVACIENLEEFICFCEDVAGCLRLTIQYIAMGLYGLEMVTYSSYSILRKNGKKLEDG